MTEETVTITYQELEDYINYVINVIRSHKIVDSLTTQDAERDKDQPLLWDEDG